MSAIFTGPSLELPPTDFTFSLSGVRSEPASVESELAHSPGSGKLCATLRVDSLLHRSDRKTRFGAFSRKRQRCEATPDELASSAASRAEDPEGQWA